MITIPIKSLGLDKFGLTYYYCCMKKIPLVDSTSTFAFRDFMKKHNHLLPTGERVEHFWFHSNGVEFLHYTYPENTIGIALGTRVWPIFVKDDIEGNSVLLADIGDYDRITKHEWFIDTTESDKSDVYDYDLYILIVFPGTTKDDGSDVEIAGFFVPKSALYNTKKRVDDVARNGKAIMKRVEVQSSSSVRKYEVLYYDDATTSCNCLAWIFSTETPKRCKHTHKVMMDICNGTLTP